MCADLWVFGELCWETRHRKRAKLSAYLKKALKHKNVGMTVAIFYLKKVYFSNELLYLPSIIKLRHVCRNASSNRSCKKFDGTKKMSILPRAFSNAILLLIRTTQMCVHSYYCAFVEKTNQTTKSFVVLPYQRLLLPNLLSVSTNILLPFAWHRQFCKQKISHCLLPQIHPELLALSSWQSRKKHVSTQLHCLTERESITT